MVTGVRIESNQSIVSNNILYILYQSKICAARTHIILALQKLHQNVHD